MGRWTNLNSNRWIAKTDVQDGINNGHLIVIGSAPSIGNEQFITRAEMEAWISCTAAGASNQWQVKSNITCPPPYPYSFTIQEPIHSFWTTKALACSETGTNRTVYSACSTFADGCALYIITDGDYVRIEQNSFSPNQWFKFSDGRVFQINSSHNVASLQTCTITTLITLDNTSSDVTITGISVAGTAITVTSGSFNVGPYSSLQGTTTNSGSVVFEVFYSSNSGGQSIYWNDGINQYCQNCDPSGGSFYQNVNLTGNNVSVNVLNGACS